MDSKDEVRQVTTRFRMKVTILVTGEVFIDTDGVNVSVEPTHLRPMVIDPTLFTHDSEHKQKLEQTLMPYAMDAVLRNASDEVRNMLKKSNEELLPQTTIDGAKA